jgi:hypothetical protein
MRALRSSICTLLLATACTTLTPKPGPPQPAPPGGLRTPDVQSVVVIVFENKDESDVRKQPFFGALAARGAYFAHDFAIAHPSQPNYVAMISGSAKGIRGDAAARLTRPHLGQRLRSWKVYAEGYPSGTCDLRQQIGRYTRKHVPFLSFADVQDDRDLCKEHVTDLAAFLADARGRTLPQFALVIPNEDHNAHDKPLAVADRWLESVVAPLLADPGFTKDVLLIITFDEDDTKWPYIHNRRNNHIYTAFLGDSVIPGSVVNTPYDHYDLLRTIEEIFHVPPIADGDTNANVMTGMWQ